MQEQASHVNDFSSHINVEFQKWNANNMKYIVDHSNSIYI
jgi:hypothetical protein